MASQTKQVFYITDLTDKKWSMVLYTKRYIVSDEDDDLFLFKIVSDEQ